MTSGTEGAADDGGHDGRGGTLLTRGQRINSALVVDRRLGEGAFAEVYRVRHHILGWQALKLFKHVAPLAATSRMFDEARILSTLGHPNIIRVFDAGTVQTSEGVRGYITTEYVAGGSLERLAASHAGGVPVGEATAVLGDRPGHDGGQRPGDGRLYAAGGEEREPARESARRADAAAALARELRAPGIDAAVHGDSVEVTFTDGLFSEADRLTSVGTDRLAVLGGRLAGRRGRVEILGHAATVPGAPTSGGSVLSLWRALIAARELSVASGKPLTAFTTASADQRDAPFALAARNRTVTVMITPGWPAVPQCGHPSLSG